MINGTQHRSKGFAPIELHENQRNPLGVDPVLLPAGPLRSDVLARVSEANQRLKQRAKERKTQADKRGKAPEYQEGTKV